MKKGLLVCISGPSGVGKGTIVKALLKEDPNVTVSVSATTRAPREGEANGVDYWFVDNTEFDRMVKNNEFLEWAQVYLNRYGTPKAACEKLQQSGKDVILEIDVQGSLNVMRNTEDVVSIFILPPDPVTLRSRLEGRGSETPESLSVRLRNAANELEISRQYDYVVVNDTVEAAVEEIRTILRSEKLKEKRNQPFIRNLIETLKEAQ